jgi:sugar phosphate isomerase/epimerase
MNACTRRDFVRAASASILVGSRLLRGTSLFASPFGLPIGLQLYSVREMLAKDYDGTLKQLSAIGYQEVEAAGFFGHTADQVKQSMKNAGLRCVSAHYSYLDLVKNFDETLEFLNQLGAKYVICSFPGFKDPARAKDKTYSGQIQSFTLEDYRWNAEQFNKLGAKAKSSGLNFGYHNHTMEFRPQDGVVPLDELIRLTDPSLVTFEMDCGWVIVGGAEPVDYLHRYPSRISMLHVKDFKHLEKPSSGAIEIPPAAELGQGVLDYRPIFEAAKKASITHYFIEQESYTMPPMEALHIDADYMRKLKV